MSRFDATLAMLVPGSAAFYARSLSLGRDESCLGNGVEVMSRGEREKKRREDERLREVDIGLCAIVVVVGSSGLWSVVEENVALKTCRIQDNAARIRH